MALRPNCVAKKKLKTMNHIANSLLLFLFLLNKMKRKKNSKCNYNDYVDSIIAALTVVNISLLN
jgi:hypothetical protein